MRFLVFWLKLPFKEFPLNCFNDDFLSQHLRFLFCIVLSMHVWLCQVLPVCRTLLFSSLIHPVSQTVPQNTHTHTHTHIVEVSGPEIWENAAAKRANQANKANHFIYYRCVILPMLLHKKKHFSSSWLLKWRTPAHAWRFSVLTHGNLAESF